jgi:hypothetical protein
MMKTIRCLLAAASLTPALVPALSSAHEPTMKFWSRAQSSSTGSLQVQAYRVDNQMLVVIHDPVSCGQVVEKPSFLIEHGDLVLHYQVGGAATSAAGETCVAHAIFQIDGLPDRDLRVRFAGGEEQETVAYLKRCPSQPPKSDEWDCLVPAN